MVLFGAEVPLPNGDNMVTLGTLGTVIAGIVAWVLKSALPNLMTKFGEFLDKQNATAKEEREAAAAERTALIAAHTEQMSQMREEVANQIAQNFATLTAAVADLAAEVKAMRVVVGSGPQPVVAIAPEPRAKRGQQP